MRDHEKIMKLVMPDRITRYLNDDKYLTERERKMVTGNAQVLLIDRILVKSIENLIKNIFGYDGVKINPPKIKQSPNYNEIIYEEKNEHSCCKFSVETFNKCYYDFEIDNIPSLPSSKHISVFFQVIVNLMNNFYQMMELKKNEEVDIEYYYASPKNSFISENFIYNLDRTVILEYLFYVFNETDYNYKQNNQVIRYGLELINKIHDFCMELSTKKVENEDIYCGFVFHNDVNYVELNSIKNINLIEPIEFGDFVKLKKILQVTNGQNIFFNVTNNFITGFFITPKKVKEIFYELESGELSFKNRPLIVSIQGEGNIYYVEGKERNSSLLLQILNSSPKIKDKEFIKNRVNKILSTLKGLESNEHNLNFFLDWVLSLSLIGHGASIVIGSFDKNEVKKNLVKYTEIEYPAFDNFGDIYNIELLNHLVKADGAIIFTEKLEPYIIASILSIPNDNSKNMAGGARHNSMLNFTMLFQDCIGITISEDGPITIFKNGEKKIRY